MNEIKISRRRLQSQQKKKSHHYHHQNNNFSLPPNVLDENSKKVFEMISVKQI